MKARALQTLDGNKLVEPLSTGSIEKITSRIPFSTTTTSSTPRSVPTHALLRRQQYQIYIHTLRNVWLAWRLYNTQEKLDHLTASSKVTTATPKKRRVEAELFTIPEALSEPPSPMTPSADYRRVHVKPKANPPHIPMKFTFDTKENQPPGSIPASPLPTRPRDAPEETKTGDLAAIMNRLQAIETNLSSLASAKQPRGEDQTERPPSMFDMSAGSLLDESLYTQHANYRTHAQLHSNISSASQGALRLLLKGVKKTDGVVAHYKPHTTHTLRPLAIENHGVELTSLSLLQEKMAEWKLNYTREAPQKPTPRSPRFVCPPVTKPQVDEGDDEAEVVVIPASWSDEEDICRFEEEF